MNFETTMLINDTASGGSGLVITVSGKPDFNNLGDFVKAAFEAHNVPQGSRVACIQSRPIDGGN